MVEWQIRERGLSDPQVLKAMQSVPRQAFVPPEIRNLAYEDMPLPIGRGQTISQPFMVATMAAALRLKGQETVLEVGTGSGYGAAVLAALADHVYTIERIRGLAERAEKTLRNVGCRNVTVVCGDGTKGLPQHAPYDAIAVTAGAPTVPQSLCDQLKIGGVLVVPVGGEQTHQKLLRVTRRGEDEFEEETLSLVSFVPLIGEEGWLEIRSP